MSRGAWCKTCERYRDQADSVAKMAGGVSYPRGRGSCINHKLSGMVGRGFPVPVKANFGCRFHKRKKGC